MNDYNLLTFDRLYKDGKKIKILINQPIEFYQNKIDILNEEYKKFNPNFEYLKQICFEIVSSLMMPIWKVPYKFVLRARQNYNKEVFSRLTQISYNSENPDVIPAGRFNLKGEAVFYCCLPHTVNDADGSLATILETDKELFNKSNTLQEKYFTLGRWQLETPTNVVVLTDFESALKKSVVAQNVNPIYDNFMNEICSVEDFKKYKLILNYFSNMAGKKNENEKEYLFTTAFFHSIREYYGEEIGIMFSSSMTDNEATNIVYSKQIVDKYLKLDLVIMFKAIRNDANKLFQIAPCSEGAEMNDKNEFELLDIEYGPF